MGNKRGFRPRQKGVECSIPGCSDWCVSNDMCPRHNMAMYRYGNAMGKVVKKVCKACGGKFSGKRDKGDYCTPGCYKSTPEYKEKRCKAVKAWRKKNKK
ncbi:MAG: hypothetical protein ACUZ8I_07355 [Candidatus Scalindua sp.]